MASWRSLVLLIVGINIFFVVIGILLGLFPGLERSPIPTAVPIVAPLPTAAPLPPLPTSHPAGLHRRRPASRWMLLSWTSPTSL